MEIQSSPDGKNWKTVKIFTPPANGSVGYFGFSDTFIFMPVKTRYLRLHFPKGSSKGASVDLMEVRVKLNNEIVSNLALYASVTASSNYDFSRYYCSNVTDGVKGVNGKGEWASLGEANPWIQLNWASSITVNEIVLYDRPNTTDSSSSGTLIFSDGSSIEVTDIPNDGSAKVVKFAPKTIQWIKFQVTSGTQGNNGLSEFEVIAFKPAEVVAVAEKMHYRMEEDGPGAVNGLLGSDLTMSF